MEWMIMPLKRYAEFSGRSSRQEYWKFFLLNVLVVAVVMGLRLGTGGLTAIAAATQSGGMFGIYGALFGGVGMLLGLWWLATIVPNIAVNVRRLHDRDVTGWAYLGFIVLSIIPLIGFLVSIAYLVFMCLKGTTGPNRFGPDPLDLSGGADVFR